MAEAFELVGEANRDEVPGAAEAVAEMLELVGLASVTEERVVEGSAAPAGAGTLSARGEVLLAEREAARAAKDFARADQIREELAELGYVVREWAVGPRLVPKS
jgi:cysteinyl-tRNA synthetase